MYDIERTIRNMQNDVVKLNTLLHQQRNLETVLEQTNILTENDFIAGLKVWMGLSESVIVCGEVWLSKSETVCGEVDLCDKSPDTSASKPSFRITCLWLVTYTERLCLMPATADWRIKHWGSSDVLLSVETLSIKTIDTVGQQLPCLKYIPLRYIPEVVLLLTVST